MANSALSQLVKLLEESQGAISIQSLAQELEVTPERVESMMDYWIRKGRIRKSTDLIDCGSCGELESCPFILDMPKTYELIKDDGVRIIEVISPGCK
jgi:hypothetical protein